MKRVPAQAPQVLIIYTPGDRNFHMFGARQVKGEWRFSKPIIRHESHLQALLLGVQRQGMTILDARAKAKMRSPGMEKATPIVISNRGVSIKDAVAAFEQLHLAILKESAQREVNAAASSPEESTDA